jgi:hypothetical protein
MPCVYLLLGHMVLLPKKFRQNFPPSPSYLEGEMLRILGSQLPI